MADTEAREAARHELARDLCDIVSGRWMKTPGKVGEQLLQRVDDFITTTLKEVDARVGWHVNEALWAEERDLYILDKKGSPVVHILSTGSDDEMMSRAEAFINAATLSARLKEVEGEWGEIIALIEQCMEFMDWLSEQPVLNGDEQTADDISDHARIERDCVKTKLEKLRALSPSTEKGAKP